ncbi:MAG: helix-turn-helix domain-containing protein [Paenibacillaceae bacterium]|nr:helix-turn-helix domain-containing protein [Paenibacillaceae bacterium]
MRLGKRKVSLHVNALYFRILASFLLLLIPTLIVGFIVYFANIHIFKKQLSDNVTSNVQSSSKAIDAYLRTSEQTGMNFLMTDTVQQYLLPANLLTDVEKEKSSSITKMLSMSRNIVNPYIDDMFVYADNQWIYKSEGMENFHSFFSEFSRFAEYKEDYWAQLLKTDFLFRVLKPTVVEKSYTDKRETVVPLVLSQFIRGNRVVMVVNISTAKIMDMLQRSRVNEATAFVVTDGQGHVVVADPTLQRPETQRLLTGLDDGMAEARLNGALAMVNSFVSEYGWHYYAVTPVAEYRKMASGILTVTTWLSFLLVIVGIALSFRFSTKLYNPIRNLLDAQNRHERFSAEFVEGAFTYIFSGNRPEKQEALMHELGFEAGQFLCCCMKFYFKEAFYADIQDTDRLLIEEKLTKVIDGILRPHVTAYVLTIQSSSFAVMVNLKRPEDRAAFDAALESILSTFRYDAQYCRLAVGIGRAYPHLGDLAQSYGEAKMALALTDAAVDFQVIDSSRLPREESFQFTFVDEQKIVNGLRAGDIALLDSELGRIVRTNLEKGTSNPYMNLLLIELYTIGVKYASEKGITPLHILQEHEHRTLIGTRPHMLDLREHLALLRRFYGEIVGRTASPDDSKSGQLVSRIIAYIDAHYTSDLYLERIATEMNLSAKYISKLFKEITGTNLTDYISIKRIQEAKLMLSTTSLKNDEIAARIGILSRATFFRLFKKYEGVTPQDYRKMLQQEQPDSPSE